MTGPGVSMRMWPIWVTGMVAAAVVVVVLVVVLVTDVLLRDIMWLSCCCCDELVKESVNVFRRSINWGFDPDTGRLLFFSSAFRSLTVTEKMLNKHHVFLIIKPTRCTNFSNLFLEWNSTCFRQFLCPSPGVFHCTYRIRMERCSILILLASCQQTCMTYTIAVCTVKNSWWWTQELSETCRGVPSWSCLQAVSKPVWHIPLLCAWWKTPDDGRRNCPKHVEFHSKN